MLKQKIPTRDQQILFMKLSGATYQSIAEKYGISRSRAREIVLYQARFSTPAIADQMRVKRVTGLRLELSVRACNALIRFFGYEPSPAVVAATGESTLLRQKHVGRMTIKELRTWLNAHGLELR